MYGLVDYYIAQDIARIIARRQMIIEAQALEQPERLSLVARLLNKLPKLTTKRELALDIQCDESSLTTAQCE